jgi:hypothetical protein
MRGASARHPAGAGYEQEALSIIAEIRDTLHVMRKAAAAIRTVPGNATAVTELLYAAERCPVLEAALHEHGSDMREARHWEALAAMTVLEDAAGQEDPGGGRHLRSVPRAG